MVVQNFIYGVLYGILGQAISFIQLQGSAKWGWHDKYPIMLVLLGLPISWSFINSVNNFITAFGGEIYPSRLLGFSVGIIVFVVMSLFLFGEGITLKTGVCLLLSLAIIMIQVLWK